MKKTLVSLMIGSAAMLQVCSAGAVDQSADAKNGQVINYGFALEAEPEATISADLNIEIAADQTKKLSLDAVISQGEEDINLNLDDIFILDKENLYLNVEEGVEALKQNIGDIGYGLFLNMVGITEDWVALPFPEVDKLGLQFTQTSGDAPQFSEKLVKDFQSVLTVLLPEVKDGVTTYKFDNDKIMQAAKAADEFIAANSEELSQLLLTNPAIGNPLTNLNITAAFEKYINAVASGMAEVTGMPENEAVEQLNAIVESFTEDLVESYGTTFKVNGQSLTPEMIENPALEENAKELLADNNILLSLSYDENSAEAIYRTDYESYVVDVAVQEDNTIKADIGDGENVYTTGIIESTETGYKGTFTDAEGEAVIATVILDIAEDEFTVALTTSDGQSFSLNGYAKVETPATPITIDIPVASDGLEVAKNIGMLLFSPLSDSTETP